MASGKSIDARLARLAELKAQASPAAALAEVQKALTDKAGLIVAKAADLASELRLREAIPQLVAGFNTHMVNSAQTDKGCVAKIAIVRALHAMDYDQTGVYEKGIAHIQFEGWGEPQDSAIPLRAISAVALAAQRYPKVLQLLLPLMIDKAASVRAAAMRAVAATGREEGQLLLQLKALIGDEDEEVLIECFCGVLDLGGAEALDFVVSFLDPNDEVKRTAAALALGACRLPGAFDVLRRQWPADNNDFRQVLLLSLATMRDPRAMEFLLSLIRDGSISHASAVIQALDASRPDERTRQQILDIVTARHDPTLLNLVRTNTRS